MEVKNNRKPYFLTILLLGLLVLTAFAQHRGDNLSFQGLETDNEFGIRALGMGGAFVSVDSSYEALFYNPAGLAALDKFSINIAGVYAKQDWWENQDYRPNRFFVTLPFYLEGLYIPDPANNGRWDYEIAQDSSYQVTPPRLGLEPHSKEAADWTKNKTLSGPAMISAVLPFNLMNRQWTAAASVRLNERIWDYDRNDTYLDPHLGYNLYGNPGRVDGSDTVYVNWSRFLRSRFGDMTEIKLALGFNLHRRIQLGAGMTISSGKTDDLLQLNRVGKFGLFDDNEFFFTYDTVNYRLEGESEFKSTKFNVGALFTFDRFSFGFNVYLPYTYTRDYSYSQFYLDSLTQTTSQISGKDEFKVPASFSLGFNFKPIDQFRFAFDFENRPYGKAEYSFAHPDSTFRKWVDVRILRFGIEFMPNRLITLRSGYRNIPTSFVPDGAAIRNSGSNAQSYTMGLTLNLGKYGAIDYAMEWKRLKYYDSYYSNTNYVTETQTRMFWGYRYSF